MNNQGHTQLSIIANIHKCVLHKNYEQFSILLMFIAMNIFRLQNITQHF